METKQILEIVNDVTIWKGDVYKLAYAIVEAQKEFDAVIAETAEQQEVADLIRSS